MSDDIVAAHLAAALIHRCRYPSGYARGRVKSIEGGTPDPAAVADATRYVKTLRDSGQLAAAGEQQPASGLTHQIERDAQGRQVLRRKRFSIS
jgi:hypothetical protein